MHSISFKTVKKFFGDKRKRSMFPVFLVFALFVLGSFEVMPFAETGVNVAKASNLEAIYWLKLSAVRADSNMTIYMGFASPYSNLFNGINVGEAPQLSQQYGQYDDGTEVFIYYTNFKNLNDWQVKNAQTSSGKGLNISFNGYGYVVTSEKFGPGTAFMSYITGISDTDNVGYFDTDESLNAGTAWAGAFIRLACGNTYPDQWNYSGEANGCGHSYGYFTDVEGVPGIYYVEIINSTSSEQSLNSIQSQIIKTDYPSYPASVGFSGRGSIDAQWAAVLQMPPGGVMPSVNFGPIYNSSTVPGITVPYGIMHYVQLTISNYQKVGVQEPYQQMIAVDLSDYYQYISSNLQNIEFFYPNGTIIPSWLESTNYRGPQSTSSLIIKVSPANSWLAVNGEPVYTNASGYAVLNGLLPGQYRVFAESPYYSWFFKTYYLRSGNNVISVELKGPSNYTGNGPQYPWEQAGPVNFANPEWSSYPEAKQGNGTVLGYYQYGAGHIGAVAFYYKNPEIIYIGSGPGPGYSGPFGDGGVYKTTDGGKQWMPADYGLPFGPVSSLFMNQSDPNELVAAVWPAGIYETDDGGYWHKVSDYRYVVDFNYENGTIYAGTAGGIIYSRNMKNWSVLHETSSPVESISVEGNYIYAMLADQELISSNDSGKTWQNVHNFSSISYDAWSVSADPFNPQVVYVSLGVYPGVKKNTWVSTDGGYNFEPAADLCYTKIVLFDPENQSKVWAIGPGYFAYSTDGGMTFTPGPLQTDNMVIAIDQLNDNTLIMGTDQGVYETKDAGIDWVSLNANLSNTLVYGLSVSHGEIAADMQDYSQFISLNNGMTWIGGNVPDIPMAGEAAVVYINPQNSSWIYYLPDGGHLLVSEDHGFDVYAVPNVVLPKYVILPNSIITSDPQEPNRLYVGTAQGIYVSSDFGKNWNLWEGSPKNVTAIQVVSQYYILAGTINGTYVYRGGMWYRSNGVSGFVSSIAVNWGNENIILATTGVYQNGTLYRSDDGGLSFSPLNTGLGSYQGSTLGFLPYPVQVYSLNASGYPFLAGTINGIYISEDYGNSWKPINYNIRSGEITDVAWQKGSLYVSTYGEGILVWRNFSATRLPAILDGYVNASYVNVSINGSAVAVFGGHWQAFLKPGYYIVKITAYNSTKTYGFTLSQAQTSNLTLLLPYKKFYSITFTESGLPSGTQWSVTLNGVTKSSTTSNITFTVVPGNYTYNASVISGYMTSQGNGTVSVGPATVKAVSIAYSEIPPPSLSAPFIMAAIFIVALILAAILVIGFLSRFRTSRKPERDALW